MYDGAELRRTEFQPTIQKLWLQIICLKHLPARDPLNIRTLITVEREEEFFDPG